MKKLLLLATMLCTAMHAQVSFSPYMSIPTGSWPETAGIGDINNDGLNDVVIGMGSYDDANNDFTIFVFTQNNSGELNPPVKYPYLTTFMDIESMDIGDLNNDNLDDVVIGYGNKIGIFFQNASGTLDAISVIATTANNANSIKIGDLNDDGLNDIGIGYYNKASVLIQSEAGIFSQVLYNCPTIFDVEVDIADANDDGRSDLVVKSYNTLHVLYQNVSGTLDAAYAYPTNATQAINGLAVGDLNNDGRNDIATAEGGNAPSAKVAIWKQNATSHLLDNPITMQAYDIPQAIEIGDMNNDGKNEIITAHGGWQNLSCYEQNNAGQYAAYNSFDLPYASHYNRQGMALGDINNDGLNDVAIADYNHGLVILYNISESLNLNESDKNQAPVVYPNPVNDVVNIDFRSTAAAGTEISIWNALGMQMAYQRKTADIESMDMAHYASGIYFIKVHTAKGDITTRIIKQ